ERDCHRGDPQHDRPLRLDVARQADAGRLQRDEQHAGGEQAAERDDRRRAEAVERVLDQQVRAAPDGGERGEKADLACVHAAECVSGAPLAPMTIRAGGYQEDLSDDELPDEELELSEEELLDDDPLSEDELLDDESEEDEDDEDAAFSRRRLA